MSHYHLLRVFCREDGSEGNRLAVFVDGTEVPMFPTALGIAEDEATGAAGLQLGARLGRAVDIRQGRGSRILVRPVESGYVEIGGSTVLDDTRMLSTL